MMRAVVDTNVLIFAAMFGGLPRYPLNIAPLRVFTLTTSPWLIEEYTSKLRIKFMLSDADAVQAGKLIEDIALVVTPGDTIDVVTRDPDDNHVLECAVAARADLIVTGDKHLLDLDSFDHIPILTVRDCLLRAAPKGTVA